MLSEQHGLCLSVRSKSQTTLPLISYHSYLASNQRRYPSRYYPVLRLMSWNGPLVHFAVTHFWFVEERVMCLICTVLYTWQRKVGLRSSTGRGRY
ncbi:hypothetical protein FOWG_18272 [Fusarium oxysporum f. sp. lycopersici MN25]|nr:hypothetical protein FOWG_18272 [Fusarium oxysporum f. sp. lycopersici MN25]